jgi:DHA3 family macrolide efflux protein-like MFS transporter
MPNKPQIPDNWLRTFIFIWTGQAFSMLGSMLVQFSLIWWLTQKTGSATILATASLVAFLPMVFLGPFAGAIVDRNDRKRIMILSDALVALMTLGLVLIAWLGVLAPWHIYIAMFIRSLGQTFHSPAMSASTTLLVPEKHYARVSGINQALAGAMNIIAPPIGALLISSIDLQWILSIDIITAMLAIAPLFLVTIPNPERPVSETQSNHPIHALFSDIKQGFLYIYHWKGLFIILLFAVTINLLINPAFSLLPLLVTNHFKGTALNFSYLESAVGMGFVVGGLGLGAWGGFKRKVLTSALGIGGMGIGSLLLGAAPGTLFPMAVAGVFILGVMNPLANGPLSALIQSRVEPAYQGRVMTVINSVATGLTPFSLAVAGPLSDRFGIQTWFILGGVSCLIIPIFMISIPSVVALDAPPPQVSVEPVPDLP